MTDTRPPRFTIVIPTRDRPRRLASCLEAVSRLRFPRARFEAVVVDDGGLHSIDPAVTAAADRIDAAVARALTDPRAHTRDIGGSASSRRCADAVIEAL